uniref:Phage tail collar domain-containing protein n=1 Tax=viral metagenome TaxID=1070528 RepID=A0A6C0HB17_9ZZZZ
MFAHRRKNATLNQILYYNNKINYHLSPHQGVVPEFQEEFLWTSKGTNNIYNVNTGNVAINMATEPLTNLDVSGIVNTSKKYTINYISIAPPVGSIMAFTVGTSPDGWLLCDGTSYGKTVYSALYAVIGSTFGVSDTSFNVPNYQGAFLRGTGTNGVYSGPSLNASQTHATQTHTHTASSVVTDSGHTHSQYTINDDYNNSGGNAYPGTIPSFAGYDSAGSKTWNNINSSTTGISVATTISNSTTSVDANETRPYNYGVWWIIKY